MVCQSLRNIQMLSQDGKREMEHNHMCLISLVDEAAIKVLTDNLEQDSAVGYRTEIS